MRPNRILEALLATAAALTLPACSLSPSAEVMKQLAKDPATVCVTVSSIYGSVRIYRSAAVNAAAACGQDALSVTPTQPPKP